MFKNWKLEQFKKINYFIQTVLSMCAIVITDFMNKHIGVEDMLLIK